MSNTVQYKTRTPDTSRGLSAGLWADCPLDDIARGHADGIVIDDHFLIQNTTLVAVTADAMLVGIPYMGFGSAGATLLAGTEHGGTFALTEATDNEAVYMRSVVQPFQISNHLGDLWFEARVKASNVSSCGMLLGLWDNTAASVIVPLSTANPPIMATTGNFVGFHMPEGAASVNTIYKADGVAVVAGQTVNSAVATLVANTYVKLGMRFERRTGLLSWYVNGVPAPNTKVVPNNVGTEFPADVGLGLLFGQRLSASAGSTVTIDRWTCAQLFA
jgi:hypothetical protein